jgi:hypothetical protein
MPANETRTAEPDAAEKISTERRWLRSTLYLIAALSILGIISNVANPASSVSVTDIVWSASWRIVSYLSLVLSLVGLAITSR